jgi:hypothetical protein
VCKISRKDNVWHNALSCNDILGIYNDGPSAAQPSRESRSFLMQKGTASAVRKLEDIGGHFVSVPGVPCWLNFNCVLQITKARGSMEAAGNTTRVVYVCSVCDKSFGDIHSSCAKHVNGRGACKEKGAVVLPLPINFSRNDRNVGGRLAHQGRLAAPGQAGDSDMVGGWPPSPARAAPVSGIHTYPISLSIRILHTYPNYPSYVSQLSYISCHLSHLSATCLCSG